jgi:hypothetical protein
VTKADRIISELAGDLPVELIATGQWLDALAMEHKLPPRDAGETDETLREKIWVKRLNDQMITIVSLLYLDQRVRR